VTLALMAVNLFKEPLCSSSMSCNVPSHTFLPIGIKHCSNNLALKAEIDILGCLSSTKDVNWNHGLDHKFEGDEPLGHKVPGYMEFHVNEGPQKAVSKIKDFLSTKVAAEVIHEDMDLQKMEAVIFVDFVALQIEVEIYSSQNRTTIMVKDRPCNDVVRLHRLCEQLKESFAWQPEHSPQNVSPRDLQPKLLPLFSLGEFEDEWVDGQTMSDKAEALLDDLTSRSASLRVEGAQVLASWAQEHPECRTHIADALLKSDAQIIEALLQHTSLPIAEAYPLAATLRYTLLCAHAASKLRNSPSVRKLLAIGRNCNGSAAAIVAKELLIAARCLDEVSS